MRGALRYLGSLLHVSLWKRALRRALFSLTPCLCFILLLESAVRLTGLDQPSLRSPFLSPGFQQIHQPDDELFFCLRRNARVVWQGVEIHTNELGLRCQPIEPKRTDEYRILSLGESTTFGARVEQDQSYSAQLEVLLQKSDRSHTYRVINAGVSAYSSFQSLRYFEIRGLKLRPDLVLFYHEANDYLPSSVREEGRAANELGLSLTDKQLHDSRRYWFYQKLLYHSACCRFLAYRAARTRIREMQHFSGPISDPFAETVGYFRTVTTEDGTIRMRLPSRVSLQERLDNLRGMLALCREQHIVLVIIHPAYADSRRHECELTEFCRSESVAMFESFPSLKPNPADPERFFLDSFHPTAEGHERLASALFEFLRDQQLVPTTSAAFCQ